MKDIEQLIQLNVLRDVELALYEIAEENEIRPEIKDALRKLEKTYLDN